MHTNDAFSMARAWYALRADLRQQSRAVAAGAGAAMALILAINVATASGGFGDDFHRAFFPLALIVGGLLFTSTLFADLHDKPRAHAYLTLPVSTLERWMVRLLMSTIGYVAATLAGYFLVTLLAAGVSEVVRGRSHGIFVPDANAWRMVLRYLVTSSVFLFGAAYFRRWHVFKVVLSISGVWLALTVIAAALAPLLFPELVASYGLGVDIMSFRLQYGAGEEIGPRLAEAIGLGAEIFFWAVMGPLFWLLTYLRLRKAEV